MPNNFIVQLLKEFWFSLQQRIVIKAAFQRLCMVPQTDIRYLNEAHGESKSWHICINSHWIFAINWNGIKVSNSI